jgi:hypothetical protein
MQGNQNFLPSQLTIGNYTILTNEVLGKGATGTVYKGTIFNT